MSKASIEWHKNQCGTLRVHLDEGGWGDPYLAACTVERISDNAAVLHGYATAVKHTKEHREAVFAALRAQGIDDVIWERKTALERRVKRRTG